MNETGQKKLKCAWCYLRHSEAYGAPNGKPIKCTRPGQQVDFDSHIFLYPEQQEETMNE